MFPIMPESVALWLVKNSKVSDLQISNFTGIHILIISKMRNFPGEYSVATVNPIMSGELTESNIIECEEDEKKKLILVKYDNVTYDNVRVDIRAPSIKKLNGIKWVVDKVSFSEVCDMFYNDIARFFNVSIEIVKDVMNKTHKKSKILVPIHPVANKMITLPVLEKLVAKYNIDINLKSVK